MHRHHELGLDDVVAVQQLALGGVAGDVHLGHALVHHGRAELHEPVDHAEHGVLVARDQGGGQHDEVALLQLHLVVPVGHAGQGRHRLALGAGDHEHDLVVAVLVHLADVHEDPVRHVEVAELRRDGHVADHGAPAEGHLATVLVGGVEDLLDAVHVGGERGHHDAALRRGEVALEGGADLRLRGGEPRDLGVRGVGHEQVHALLAETGEGAQVRDAAVERQLVHLEVAGVQDGAGVRVDGDGERVRDRVVHGHELALERAELDDVVFLDHAGARLDPVLLELGLDQGEGQLGADHGDVVAQAQQVRHGADVVLVAVGQDDADDVVHAVPDVVEVRQDQVDAGLVLLGEEDAAVDDEDLAVDLEGDHVAADLLEAAQLDDAAGAPLELGRGGQAGACGHGTGPF